MTKKIKAWCEVCGKEEIFVDFYSAYKAGYDIPPKIGNFGVISPRTCKNCSIVKTVWWKLVMEKTNIENLSNKDKLIINRILAEPDIYYVNDE